MFRRFIDWLLRRRPALPGQEPKLVTPGMVYHLNGCRLCGSREHSTMWHEGSNQ